MMCEGPQYKGLAAYAKPERTTGLELGLADMKRAAAPLLESFDGAIKEFVSLLKYGDPGEIARRERWLESYQREERRKEKEKQRLAAELRTVLMEPGRKLHGYGCDLQFNKDCGEARVLLVLERGEETKYLQTFVGNKEYIVAVPPYKYHGQIKTALEDALGERIYDFQTKGGWMVTRYGILKLYSTSEKFGRADHEHVAEVIRRAGLEAIADETGPRIRIREPVR